ncbi:lytic transglycosylase domain-containing protein [Sphingopyxis macrogoltabida]|uniref:lytic transglycosylase domain-containing protein n=1 Tax=Sphingopyxis macrogoltabida TaxID=33050 RepID=UPI001F353D84|nr:lytic transglycosylase domain-containing protein [Sphingopyxis macrogoltabida]
MGDTAGASRGRGASGAAVDNATPRVGAEVLAYRPKAGLIEQMQARLRALPGGQFAEAIAAEPEWPALVAPVSAISVPLWMRPGSVLSGETWGFVPGCTSPGYRPTGFLGSDAELRRASYYGMMSRIACEYGIPVGLFDAMIIRESRYHPTIVSPKNAFGLTQLMPATAAGLGVDRYSVEGNLRGGASYLRQQLDRFGQYHLALAAYNAGPGRVRGGLVPRIRETQDYVVNVLSNWGRLSGVQRQVAILPADGNVPRESIVPEIRQRTAAVWTY